MLLTVVGARARIRRSETWWPYGQGVIVVLLCTGIAWLLSSHFRAANLVMVYLLGIVIAAMRLGRGASILTAALMMENLGFNEAAARMRAAVRSSITQRMTTSDLGGSLNTSQVGDWICSRVQESKP